MTNLSQVCLFSNLITIPVQWCGFWVSFMRTQLFFTGFKVKIYWEMIKIPKRVGKSKRGRIKYQGGSIFFFFYQLKVLSHFAPVSPDTILKERSLGQSQWLPCCFEYYDLDTRRNLKYFEQ